ncbi:N-acetyltransferase family protein [Exiguobacterium sp. NPDC077395]|uniref:GNAT family N-acetyltransferase n=1 Tax=Exiguobacterium sp. NPDC077395 TaxID=3390563 RepID=UPI003D09316F
MIRNCRRDDLQMILHIYNDAIVNSTAVYHYEPVTLENRVAWYEEKKEQDYPIIVWVEDDVVMGFATFGPFRPWPAYHYTVEHSVYVHPGYRGKGIGNKLLKEIIRIAEARGMKTVIGGIDASNVTSIRAHEKVGFVHSGTIRNAGYKFGKWLDLSFYQLDLEGPASPTEG